MKGTRGTTLPRSQNNNKRQCDERVELLEVIKEMVEQEVDRRLKTVLHGCYKNKAEKPSGLEANNKEKTARRSKTPRADF